jgi:hypothetical protein
MTQSVQKTSGQVIAALIFISLGVLLWLGTNLLWPMFILVPGMILMGIAYSGGKCTAPFAIPGMLTLGTGALLFFQNVFGYWESWSYAWTLYGVFLGMGLIIMGQQAESDGLQEIGRGFIKVSLILFAGFAFLMELVIGVGGGRGLLPVLLIGLGLYLLLRNTGSPAKPKRKSVKRKHPEDVLFTGPIVYGSRRDNS